MYNQHYDQLAVSRKRREGKERGREGWGREGLEEFGDTRSILTKSTQTRSILAKVREMDIPFLTYGPQCTTQHYDQLRTGGGGRKREGGSGLDTMFS